VAAVGPASVHQALLFRQLTGDLICGRQHRGRASGERAARTEGLEGLRLPVRDLPGGMGGTDADLAAACRRQGS
jgi:hypothetical protein